jgi:recombination protein RecA
MATKTESRETAKETESANANSAKAKALDMAMQQIEKQFGKGSIMKLGDRTATHVDVIPTGAISLDIALGVGGIPRGRIIEIYGPESSGKTTLAMHVIAECQARGGVCAFIDAEHAFDPHYADNIGLKTDELLISQPDYGEQALEILETLVRSGAVSLIVVDSVAALTPKAEIEGEMGDAHMGLQARLMSQALRKITAICAKTGTAVIFLNQLRMKIGVMFGNPETTTGGNALKFYASVRLDIRKKDKIGTLDDVQGHSVKVKVVKNKMAPPFKEAMFDIIYPNGIDKISSLIDAAVTFDVVQRAGAWFRRGDVQLAQGKEALKEMLKTDDKLRKEIYQEVKKKANLP